MHCIRLVFVVLIFTLTAAVSSAGGQKYGVDNPFPLDAVAGRTQAEVATVLGEPSSCEEGKYGKKCFFKDGDVEIVFINEAADWITVTPEAVPFNKFSLIALGLDPQAADAVGVDQLHWSSIEGIRSVDAHKTGANVWYFYIKTSTE